MTTIHMHSSLRHTKADLAKALSQHCPASFIQTALSVWDWYTSHHDTYTPSREQAKRELALSDYLLTKSLRLLEKLGLAVCDIARKVGKYGCWRVLKQAILPPKVCQAKEPVLPPKVLGAIGKQENTKVNNINPPPPVEPVITPPPETVTTGGGDDWLIDRFLSIYPKQVRAAEADSAKSKLKSLNVPNFAGFMLNLIKDCTVRKIQCRYWRDDAYIPYVNNYILARQWERPFQPYPAKTAQKAFNGVLTGTRGMTLADELKRDWAQ